MTKISDESFSLCAVFQIRILSVLGLLICLLALSRTAWQGSHSFSPPVDDVEKIIWMTGLSDGEGFYKIGSLIDDSVLPHLSLAEIPNLASLSFSAEGEAVVSGIHARTALLFFQPIPLNLADAQVLAALPNIGPALSGRILTKRQELGGFERVDQLLQVKGVGPKTYEHLKNRLTL